MSFVLWLLLGALSGWIASMVMGSNSSQGLLGDIVLGIIGAFLGGFIFNLLGTNGVTGFNFWSLVVSVIGAVIALMIGRAITRSV
ncbi:MAG: GlsB/YeaQ/YmgE family stress response membrane protein [bacterium]|nr:GlsB/YeaQ/YmgE family stress response membrane protein [bacterium]